MVGMASDSVFLRQTVKAGLSPSHSWGFDYGRQKNDDELPGELVIGGYNAAKASYKDFTNYTLFKDLNKPCPLQVEVEGMRWGDVNLMSGQGLQFPKFFMFGHLTDAFPAPFSACIEPAYWTNIMPTKVQDNFNRTMQASNYEFWKETWEYFYYNVTNSSKFSSANLQIKLNNGFTVDIPPSELYGRIIYRSDQGRMGQNTRYYYKFPIVDIFG